MSQTIASFFDRLSSGWDAHSHVDPKKVLSLLKKAGIREGDRVLDLGCGTGVLTPFLLSSTNGEIIGLDVSAGMIEEAKKKYAGEKRVRFINADFYSYEDEAFDLIVCFDAYPHFLDAKGFAKKAHSLLKEGGRVAILHDCGRAALGHFHEGMDETLSRELKAPEEEIKPFLPYFDCILAEEDENHYILLLAKK